MRVLMKDEDEISRPKVKSEFEWESKILFTRVNVTYEYSAFMS